MPRPYVLEVQEFTKGKESWKTGMAIEKKGIKVFISKKKACDYYDKYNKHMRSLNAHGLWRSDWDPQTWLRYVVREYSGECRNIEPFHDE